MYVLVFMMIFFSFSNYTFSSCHFGNEERECVEKALDIELMPVDDVIDENARQCFYESFDYVKKGFYFKAFELIVNAVKKFPSNFLIQGQLATLFGDYGQGISDVCLKEKMINKSKQMFDKLYLEIETQPKSRRFGFKNEYFYRFALYEKQYMNGHDAFTFYWNTALWEECAAWCYYKQGVGAANYARVLFENGQKEQSLEWAVKAIVAWSQHFMYENSYYNSYVHYAYALAISGHMQEAEAALKRSLNLLGKKNYDEFSEIKEVVEWVTKHCNYKFVEKVID